MIPKEAYDLGAIIAKTREDEHWKDAMNRLLPEPYIATSFRERLWYWLRLRRAVRWKPNPAFNFDAFFGTTWQMPRFNSLTEKVP